MGNIGKACDVASLVGEYERSIDGNSRLTLPSVFAAQFDGAAYLTDDPEGCVRLTLAAEFDRRLMELRDQLAAGEVDHNDVRAHTESSRLVKIDKQGRVTLDEQARRDANIAPDSDVVLLGFIDSIEIWRPSRRNVIKGETRRAKPRRTWDDEDA